MGQHLYLNIGVSPTYLLWRPGRLTRLVHKDELKGIQSLIFDFESRAEGHDLHIILDHNFAENAVRILPSTGPKREGVFPLPVNGDASDLIPILTDELQPNAVMSC